MSTEDISYVIEMSNVSYDSRSKHYSTRISDKDEWVVIDFFDNVKDKRIYLRSFLYNFLLAFGPHPFTLEAYKVKDSKRDEIELFAFDFTNKQTAEYCMNNPYEKYNQYVFDEEWTSTVSRAISYMETVVESVHCKCKPD